MGNKVILSSVALKELQESLEWYESHSQGLGVRFIELIDKAIKLIALHPEGYPIKKAPYREIVLGKFPYLIIYEFIKDKQTIYVLHVFNTKQNPKQKYKR